MYQFKHQCGAKQKTVIRSISRYFFPVDKKFQYDYTELVQTMEACPNDVVPCAIYVADILLRLFGMLISPSQKRLLYRLGLCICCFARESRHMGRLDGIKMKKKEWDYGFDEDQGI
jgi:hypothetical protein